MELVITEKNQVLKYDGASVSSSLLPPAKTDEDKTGVVHMMSQPDISKSVSAKRVTFESFCAPCVSESWPLNKSEKNKLSEKNNVNRLEMKRISDRDGDEYYENRRLRHEVFQRRKKPVSSNILQLGDTRSAYIHTSSAVSESGALGSQTKKPRQQIDYSSAPTAHMMSRMWSKPRASGSGSRSGSRAHLAPHTLASSVGLGFRLG